MVVLFCACVDSAWGQSKPDAGQTPPAAAPAPAAREPAAKPGVAKQGAASAAALEQQDLQKAIEQASNDRAALMHNLLDFLKKYPQSSHRGQIYRAIVETSLQLRDFATATEYAERMVALDPGDLSTNLLSVQLLERYSDTAGWRRATNYCTRVIELIGRGSANEKSPRVSNEQFEKDKQRDAAAIFLVRGRLHQKLNEMQEAQKDFEESYRRAPGAPSAERLGELAELRKDLAGAIHQYALAFALAATKRKVLVMNFWTTWCGPCREWEPHFEKVAGHFAGQEKNVVFLEVNCDEDETLVGPYLAEEKPKNSVLFADGLDLLLLVNSFPTTLILDRAGKIAYRAEGFDPEGSDQTLVEAIERMLHPAEMMAPAAVAP